MTNVILPSMDELTQKLMDYKNAKKMTNSDLAKRLDVPEVYIYRWQKGKMGRAYRRIVEDFLRIENF